MTSSDFNKRKIVSMSGLRWKMKSESNYQIGQTALVECSKILIDFLDELILEANKNLDDENEKRNKAGLDARKTLQGIDFVEAYKGIEEPGVNRK